MHTICKAVLVDDEAESLQNLHQLINHYCNEIEVVACFKDPTALISYLELNTVNCLFLDINMPGINGFELLKLIDTNKLHIVFVTAYSNYAIQALRANAVDFLLKPILKDELINATARLIKRVSQQEDNTNSIELATIIDSFKQHKASLKITVPTTHGFKVITTSSIIRLCADGPYTKIILQDEKAVFVSKNIGYFQSILPVSVFLRVHHSHLININFLIEYSNLDGLTAIMADGYEVSISRRKVKEFKANIDAYFSN